MEQNAAELIIKAAKQVSNRKKLLGWENTRLVLEISFRKAFNTKAKHDDATLKSDFHIKLYKWAFP